MSRDSGIEIDQESLAALQKRNSSELDALARHVRNLENAARQWNEDVRRQLDQIQSEPQSGGSDDAGGELQQRIARLEGHLGKIQGDSRVDALLLRMGEVERKVGEGTPDPLLNEIAHRLAALERDSMVGGTPSPEIVEKLADLEQRISQASGQDPRTDDLILRVASFESMVKHPERTDAIADLKRQLAELQSRPVATPDEDLRPELASVQQRISELESRSSDTQDGVATELREQIEALRTQLEESQNSDGGVGQRLADLESQVMPKEAIAGIEERLGERIAALADQVNPVESDQRYARLVEQIDSVRTEIQAAQPTRETESLLSRLEAVEQQLSDSPANEWFDQLQTRLATLEERLTSSAEDSRVEAVARQVDELQKQVADSHDPRVENLMERLEALERDGAQSVGADPAELTTLRSEVQELTSRIAEARDSRVDSLVTRVSSLEASPDQAGDLEAIRAEIKDLSTAVIQDDRLEALIGRLETLEQRVADATPPDQVEALQERISRIEMRSAEAASGGQVQELTQRVFALEEGGGDSKDPRIDELVERIDALQEKLGEEGGVDKRMARGFVELANRLKMLEERQSSLVSNADIEELRSRLLDAQSSGASVETNNELENRLATLEMRLAESSETTGDPELASRLEALESRSGGDNPALEAALQGLRDRVAELEQASPSGQDSAAGLSAVEARLEKLEVGFSAGSGGVEADFGPLAERLDRIEARSARVDPEMWESMLEGVRDRLAAVEESGGASGGPGADTGVLGELRQRLQAVENASNGSESGPELDELRARVAQLEARPADGAGVPLADGALQSITERLGQLEAQAPTSDNAELLARIGELENSIVQLSTSSGGGDSAALEQERERWGKSFDQLVDHVRAIEERLDGEGEPVTAGGNAQEAITMLADRLGAAMDRNAVFEHELQATRTKMWYIAAGVGFGLFFIVFFLLISQLFA